ncbi:MAG: serine protease [Methanotrichaceae archaeon]|jgi:hypothetical protein
MALIPKIFLDCVTAIGVRNPDGSSKWIGTGFLVGRLFETDQNGIKQYHTFLVTNKHVLTDRKNIIARFNPEPSSGNTAKDYTIELVDAKGKSLWIGHPHNDVDVAVIYINPTVLRSDGRKFACFQADESILSIKGMAEAGISEGDFIYALGFPLGIVGPEMQYVIARSGIVARISDTLEGKTKDFIADISNYPGNSGSPVISKPANEYLDGTKCLYGSRLLGILHSYIPYTDVAVSTQTGRPRITFEENSGLALVTPTDYITETIEIYYKTLMEPIIIQQKEETAPTPTPSA